MPDAWIDADWVDPDWIVVNSGSTGSIYFLGLRLEPQLDGSAKIPSATIGAPSVSGNQLQEGCKKLRSSDA